MSYSPSIALWRFKRRMMSYAPESNAVKRELVFWHACNPARFKVRSRLPFHRHIWKTVYAISASSSPVTLCVSPIG